MYEKKMLQCSQCKMCTYKRIFQDKKAATHCRFSENFAHILFFLMSVYYTSIVYNIIFSIKSKSFNECILLCYYYATE